MIDRIQKILKSKHLSPSQFADQIQVQRSSVSHILSGRNKPSLDFVMKVLTSYPDVDAEWLLFGKGIMNKGAESNSSEKKSSSISQDSPHIESKEMNREINNRPGILKSEAPTYYGQGNRIKKVVILYSDNTFEEFMEQSS